MKRIIAFSTISQLGYFKLTILFILIINEFYSLNYLTEINSNISLFSVLPLSIKEIKVKDQFLSYIENKDSFTDFSSKGKSLIKIKYYRVQGIYLWVNNTNNRSYVGKSVNLYQRLNNYLSKNYIMKTKNKMAICAAIDK
jgi:hypothetical protein